MFEILAIIYKCIVLLNTVLYTTRNTNGYATIDEQ